MISGRGRTGRGGARGGYSGRSGTAPINTAKPLVDDDPPLIIDFEEEVEDARRPEQFVSKIEDMRRQVALFEQRLKVARASQANSQNSGGAVSSSQRNTGLDKGPGTQTGQTVTSGVTKVLPRPPSVLSIKQKVQAKLSAQNVGASVMNSPSPADMLEAELLLAGLEDAPHQVLPPKPAPPVTFPKGGSKPSMVLGVAPKQGPTKRVAALATHHAMTRSRGGKVSTVPVHGNPAAPARLLTLTRAPVTLKGQERPAPVLLGLHRPSPLAPAGTASLTGQPQPSTQPGTTKTATPTPPMSAQQKVSEARHGQGVGKAKGALHQISGNNAAQVGEKGTRPDKEVHGGTSINGIPPSSTSAWPAGAQTDQTVSLEVVPTSRATSQLASPPSLQLLPRVCSPAPELLPLDNDPPDVRWPPRGTKAGEGGEQNGEVGPGGLVAVWDMFHGPGPSSASATDGVEALVSSLLSCVGPEGFPPGGAEGPPPDLMIRVLLKKQECLVKEGMLVEQVKQLHKEWEACDRVLGSMTEGGRRLTEDDVRLHQGPVPVLSQFIGAIAPTPLVDRQYLAERRRRELAQLRDSAGTRPEAVLQGKPQPGPAAPLAERSHLGLDAPEPPAVLGTSGGEVSVGPTGADLPRSSTGTTLSGGEADGCMAEVDTDDRPAKRLRRQEVGSPDNIASVPEGELPDSLTLPSLDLIQTEEGEGSPVSEGDERRAAVNEEAQEVQKLKEGLVASQEPAGERTESPQAAITNMTEQLSVAGRSDEVVEGEKKRAGKSQPAAVGNKHEGRERRRDPDANKNSSSRKRSRSPLREVRSHKAPRSRSVSRERGRAISRRRGRSRSRSRDRQRSRSPHRPTRSRSPHNVRKRTTSSSHRSRSRSRPRSLPHAPQRGGAMHGKGEGQLGRKSSLTSPERREAEKQAGKGNNKVPQVSEDRRASHKDDESNKVKQKRSSSRGDTQEDNPPETEKKQPVRRSGWDSWTKQPVGTGDSPHEGEGGTGGQGVLSEGAAAGGCQDQPLAVAPSLPPHLQSLGDTFVCPRPVTPAAPPETVTLSTQLEMEVKVSSRENAASDLHHMGVKEPETSPPGGQSECVPMLPPGLAGVGASGPEAPGPQVPLGQQGTDTVDSGPPLVEPPDAHKGVLLPGEADREVMEVGGATPSVTPEPEPTGHASNGPHITHGGLDAVGVAPAAPLSFKIETSWKREPRAKTAAFRKALTKEKAELVKPSQEPSGTQVPNPRTSYGSKVLEGSKGTQIPDPPASCGPQVPQGPKGTQAPDPPASCGPQVHQGPPPVPQVAPLPKDLQSGSLRLAKLDLPVCNLQMYNVHFCTLMDHINLEGTPAGHLPVLQLAGRSGGVRWVPGLDMESEVEASQEYESPLRQFRSYRLNRYYPLTAGGPWTNKTFCHVIDPHWPLCKFEARGACKDAGCPWQHAQDYQLSGTEARGEVSDLLRRAGVTLKLDDVQSSLLKDIKEAVSQKASSRLFSDYLQTRLQEGKRAASRAALKAPRLAPEKRCYPRKPPRYTRLPLVVMGQADANHSDKSYHLAGHRVMANRMLSFSWGNLPCWVDLLKPCSAQPMAATSVPPPRSSRYFTPSSAGSHGPTATEVHDHSTGEGATTDGWLLRALTELNAGGEGHRKGQLVDSSVDRSLGLLMSGLEQHKSSPALWILYLELYSRRAGLGSQVEDLCTRVPSHQHQCYQLWLEVLSLSRPLQRALTVIQLAMVHLGHSSPASTCDAEEREQFYRQRASCVLDLCLRMMKVVCELEEWGVFSNWSEQVTAVASGLEGQLSEDEGQALVGMSVPDPSDPAPDGLPALAQQVLLRVLHYRPKEALVMWLTSAHMHAYQKMPEHVLACLGRAQPLAAVYFLNPISPWGLTTAERVLLRAAGKGCGCLDLFSAAHVFPLHLRREALSAKEILLVSIASMAQRNPSSSILTEVFKACKAGLRKSKLGTAPSSSTSLILVPAQLLATQFTAAAQWFEELLDEGEMCLQEGQQAGGGADGSGGDYSPEVTYSLVLQSSRCIQDWSFLLGIAYLEQRALIQEVKAAAARASAQNVPFHTDLTSPVLCRYVSRAVQNWQLVEDQSLWATLAGLMVQEDLLEDAKCLLAFCASGMLAPSIQKTLSKQTQKLVGDFKEMILSSEQMNKKAGSRPTKNPARAPSISPQQLSGVALRDVRCAFKKLLEAQSEEVPVEGSREEGEIMAKELPVVQGIHECMGWLNAACYMVLVGSWGEASSCLEKALDVAVDVVAIVRFIWQQYLMFMAKCSSRRQSNRAQSGALQANGSNAGEAQASKNAGQKPQSLENMSGLGPAFECFLSILFRYLEWEDSRSVMPGLQLPAFEFNSAEVAALFKPPSVRHDAPLMNTLWEVTRTLTTDEVVCVIEGLLSRWPSTPSLSQLLINVVNMNITDSQWTAWSLPLMWKCVMGSWPPPSPSVWVEALRLTHQELPEAVQGMWMRALAAHPYSVVLWRGFARWAMDQGGKEVGRIFESMIALGLKPHNVMAAVEDRQPCA